MNLKIKNTCEYEGPIDSAPRWARWSVVPWYRRILVAPITINLTIVTGVMFNANYDGMLNFFLTIPCFILFAHTAAEAQKKWYHDRFIEAKALQEKEI